MTPPERISIKNNEQGLVYTIQDTSDYMDIPDGGLYGRTEFVTDCDSKVGTSVEIKGSIRFIPIIED